MAFFNDLRRRVTASGQNAIQKTKDMTEISKLNSLISEREQSIDAACLRIGKLYAELHREDFEPGFAEDIASIAHDEEKIAELRARIMGIRGTALCVSCGSEIPASAAYCENCGARQKSGAGIISCPGCGQPVQSGSSFCQFCGIAISAAAPDDMNWVAPDDGTAAGEQSTTEPSPTESSPTEPVQAEPVPESGVGPENADKEEGSE